MQATLPQAPSSVATPRYCAEECDMPAPNRCNDCTARIRPDFFFSQLAASLRELDSVCILFYDFSKGNICHQRTLCRKRSLKRSLLPTTTIPRSLPPPLPHRLFFAFAPLPHLPHSSQCPQSPFVVLSRQVGFGRASPTLDTFASKKGVHDNSMMFTLRDLGTSSTASPESQNIPDYYQKLPNGSSWMPLLAIAHLDDLRTSRTGHPTHERVGSDGARPKRQRRASRDRSASQDVVGGPPEYLTCVQMWPGMQRGKCRRHAAILSEWRQMWANVTTNPMCHRLISLPTFAHICRTLDRNPIPLHAVPRGDLPFPLFFSSSGECGAVSKGSRPRTTAGLRECCRVVQPGSSCRCCAAAITVGASGEVPYCESDDARSVRGAKLIVGDGDRELGDEVRGGKPSGRKHDGVRVSVRGVRCEGDPMRIWRSAGEKYVRWGDAYAGTVYGAGCCCADGERGSAWGKAWPKAQGSGRVARGAEQRHGMLAALDVWRTLGCGRRHGDLTASLEGLRKSHISHVMAFWLCASEWLHRQNMTHMASIWGLEPFTCHFCARPESHDMAPMAFAQPGYFICLGDGFGGVKRSGEMQEGDQSWGVTVARRGTSALSVCLRYRNALAATQDRAVRGEGEGGVWDGASNRLSGLFFPTMLVSTACLFCKGAEMLY
ncbi:hypothetical protein DFH06DRAFT_1151993 [Mycena polygramma]|nr:hypothetical protein DFH06DRAFT_1151993 [Mycena polygramma]